MLHRHAARYLERMPADRQAQMKTALRAVAALNDLAGHPNISPMSGEWKGCYRLRVGSYRAIFQWLTSPEEPDGIMEVLIIGPRGDVYK